MALDLIPTYRGKGGILTYMIFFSVLQKLTKTMQCYRFFRQFLLLFLMNEASSGLFRFIAGLARHQVVASTLGSFCILIFMLTGGFVLARGMQK